MKGDEQGKGGVGKGCMATTLPLVEEESGKRVNKRVTHKEWGGRLDMKEKGSGKSVNKRVAHKEWGGGEVTWRRRKR